jgi:aminoglycoside phosphotransferase family enzyme/predicted kinase
MSFETMSAAPSIEAFEIGTESVLNIDGLLNEAAYAHPVRDIKLRETHISWVILTGEYAYKIKKRVKLEFLDTTTLATRLFLCNEELRLNKRLAPDLYLEVMPITQDNSGIHLGGAGKIIDYAVKMQQFDASQELPALLVRADVTVQEVIRLAERLAEFHCQAALAPDDAGFDYLAQLRNSVLGNVAALLTHLNSLQEFPAMGQLIDWTHDSLHELHERFRKRQSRGYIRECHGDLHAHNIVRWHGQLTPFDCLEFDPKLRWIDVMNDVAFLVMDLVGHDRKDLAYEFLSRYVEQTGDYAGIRLLPFYAVYRALVRAMVDGLRGEQQPAQRLALNGRLHGRISTALQFMHPKRPSLIIMHGPSGSGKSWLSERLVPLVAAVRLRSDLERKRLADAEPARGAGSAPSSDLYTPTCNDQTYSRLLKCAESCLLGEVSVIVDAAFLNADDRERFKSLAERCGASFVILSCIADKAEMARRIASRAQANADASEATIAVLENQLLGFVPIRADESAHVIRVDTLQPNPQRAAFATLQAREVNLGVREVASPQRRDRELPRELSL